FSSRRRHTSFSRDWSSDVCSSDLRARSLSGSNMSLPPRSPCKALTKPPNLSPSRDPTLSVHDHGRFRPGTPRDKRPSWPHQTPRQHGTPSSAPRRPARPIIKLQAKPRVGAALTTEQPTRPTAPYVYEEGLEMAEIRGATFTHKLFHTRSFAWLWAV